MRCLKAKGTKMGVLPDFFIGAQAETESWRLLTQDVGRYRTYFPGAPLDCFSAAALFYSLGADVEHFSGWHFRTWQKFDSLQLNING